jgi:thiol-disulfide isomerase/thioredoxin
MKLDRRKIIIVFIITIFANAFAILSGYFGWNLQFAFVGISFFLAGILFSKELAPKLVLLVIIFSPFLIIYDLHVFINHLVHVYPIAIFPFFSFGLGFFLYKYYYKSKPIFYTATISFILVLLLSWKVLMPNYLVYVFSYEEVELETESADFPDLLLYDSAGESVKLNKYRNKIMVLDFWSTTCGICFRSFPEFEKLEKKYKGRDDVIFFAIGVVNSHQSLEAVMSKASTLPYDFSYLFMERNKNNNPFISKYIRKVPVVIIVGKTGKIAYIGGGAMVYNKNTYRNINGRLEEIFHP